MKMNKRLLLLVGMAIAFVSAISAANLKEAADAYEKGDYPKAVEIYEEIVKDRGTSAPLLTDLGNAYFKTGDFGQALLCYYRALRLDPSDSQAKGNIAYITSKVEDNNKAEAKGKKVSVVPEDLAFFSSLRRYVVYSHLSDSWALWGGILFVITCGCAAIYIFSSNVLARKVGFFGGFIALGFSVLTLVFALLSASDRSKSSQGVITAYKVHLLAEPDREAKVGANALTRGTLLDVLEVEKSPDSETKWYKVRLNSDYAGWVESNDFEVI